MEDRHLCKARPIGTRKQWVTGFYAVLGEKTVIIVNEPEKFYDVDSGKNSHGNKIVEVIPNTICQCTGLKDKNGKLIWENDVVEAWSQGRCAIGKIKHRIDGTWIMYPAWQNGEMWYLLPNDDGITTVEVIGNIFDNPELLEE